MKTTLKTLQQAFSAILLMLCVQQYASAQNAVATISSNDGQTSNSNNNIAFGKTATASSTAEVSHAASYAVDGDYSTRFASLPADNQWLSVDLGKSYLVTDVIIAWEKSYGKDFNILFSNNGSFTDMFADSIQVRNHALSANSLAGVDTFHAKSNTAARYVRIQGIKSANGKGYSIWEMQVFGVTASTNLFPVSVTGFSASQQNTTGLVQWTTVTENSNAGYTVERSSDAVSFSAIGYVPARNAGNLTSYYSFLDKQPFSGKNYYRLKQTWLDGKIGYSAIVTITVFSSGSSINVYPVPVKNSFTIEYHGTAGESIHLSIYNGGGLPVYATVVSVQSGQQVITINRTAAMRAGQYFLNVVSSANKKYTEKILLQ